MDGSRSDRARARAQQLLAEIAPLPDDSELQRLRELSLNYIREAERAEGNAASTREDSEQISAALDAIARDFFAQALQSKSRSQLARHITSEGLLRASSFKGLPQDHLIGPLLRHRVGIENHPEHRPPVTSLHASVCWHCAHNLILVDEPAINLGNQSVTELVMFSFERSAYSFFGVAMENFSKVAAQVRGARALLGWSQSYLAEGISVRRVIIADLESCKRAPQEATLSALITELSAAGIVFTETGVEFVEWPPRPYVPTGCTMLKKRARRQWCSRTVQTNS